ncbi:MAG: GatB/YqeY domain-containing protein, partial [Actinobacteria bacterium]|nr:GatB/YqeY domain-containing protein [Actinomycetota bacterium]
MSQMKNRLKEDLTTAIKSRDELTAATLRMALTAITNEEVAGKEARALSDDDVIAVLGREAKKRRESAEAYDTADRPELAERERAELGVLAS